MHKGSFYMHEHSLNKRDLSTTKLGYFSVILTKGHFINPELSPEYHTSFDIAICWYGNMLPLFKKYFLLYFY